MANTADEPVITELAPTDIEVRAPTVVLSVRLDDATARQLHGLASRRGVRISEVLREAAEIYAKSGGSAGEPWYRVVGGADVDVAVGQQPIITGGMNRTKTQGERFEPVVQRP